MSYVQKGVVVYHGPFGGNELLEPGDFHRINVAPDDQAYKFDAIMAGDTHIIQSGFNPELSEVETRGKKLFFSHADRHGILKLIASLDGKDASLSIQRDVHMYSEYIPGGHNIDHPLSLGQFP